MATYISYPQRYGKEATSSYNMTNIENAVDANDNTYATLSLSTYSSTSIYFSNFDVSGIPTGSTINNITISIKIYLPQKTVTSINSISLRKNGLSEMQKNTQQLYIPGTSNGSQLTTDFDDEFSTNEVGSWTLEELQWSDNSKNNGFYFEIKFQQRASKVQQKLYSVKLIIDYTAPSFTITTNSIPQIGGTVSGAGTYSPGDTVTLIATPADGYQFDHWHPDNSTNPIKTFSATSDQTWTAYFIQSSKIFNGTSKIQKIYLGTTPIKKIYIGTTQIF